MEDQTFTHNGRDLMAVDAGFYEGGCRIYEIQTMDGDYVDSMVVNPLNGVQRSIIIWEQENPLK